MHLPVVDGSAGPHREAFLSAAEIRDYDVINKEVARLLDLGATRIVLTSVEGQRLLASRLKGSWVASILVDGRAGPELGAELDAPGLIVTASGDVADGAGRGIVSGRIDILGNATDGLGYSQRGGTVVVRGDAGDRAGLLQRGGLLVVAGRLGRLAAERQRGGVFVARRDHFGPHVGLGRTGGRLLRLDPDRLPGDAVVGEFEKLFSGEDGPDSGQPELSS